MRDEEYLMPMSEPEDAGSLAARPDRLPQPEVGIRQGPILRE